MYQSHKAVDLDGDGINDAIDVTFDHVGDGLQVINTAYTGAFGVSHDDGLGVISETDDLHGFAIAGTGGRQSKDHRQKHGAGLEQWAEKPRQCHL